MKFNIRQEKVLNATEPKILCLATAACGKAILNTEIIPTPDGPKKVDEINVGDYLFDRNGLPTKVLGVYPQGKREVYELTFGDGRKAKSSIDHIWYVHKRTWRNKDEYREYTTQQLLDEGLIRNDRSANFSIPVSKAVVYPEKQYSIHPYVVGAFLGDGCCLCHPLTLSSENEEIPNQIASLLGKEVKAIKLPYENYSWEFRDGNSKIYSSILPEELLHYSYDKKIPEEYKYGSIEQRLELIRGLMDTDGTIIRDKRQSHASVATVSYCSTSYNLILDVKEVLGSLGYVSSISEDNRNDKYTNEKCYRLIINISNQDKHKLFWLSRKKEIALSVKDLPQKKDYFRTSIREIKSLGYEEEMTCFLVDNEEHLFLMNDFIVTHNTRVLTERIRLLINERGVSPRDIVAITFTNMAADEMKRRLGSIANEAFIGTIHSYGNKVCLSNNINTQPYVDNYEFDKILKKAITIPSERYPHVKHVLIDECQDLSPLEYAFLEKIPTENIFFVGDNRQCQPAGTKVKLRNGVIKNIEDVVVGDSIVWYDNNKSYLSSINISHNSLEKKVLKTASRDFVDDNIIKITTENGFSSSYTPNHITFVKIHPSEYNHAVYLMCDENNRFRVGKIPFTCLNQAGTNPWRDKMYAEGCSKIWILKVFKTDKEARRLETKISYQYQIPQTCWQTSKVSWTKEDIDYIYEGLDTFSSAKKCLKNFKRDYNYPLLDKETEKSMHIHFAKNAITEIFAANLMPEVMDVLVYDNALKNKKRYEQIIDIEYQFISTPIKVYSLETEGGTYVADDIVTHNCIYGFKGSTDEYLVSMYEDETYKKYYLVENYRNAQDILNFADSLIASFIQLSPKSIPVKTKRGEVIKESFYEALEELEYTGNWGSWFILTRTNAELAQVQEMLDQKKIPNITFKKGDLDLTELDQLMQSDRVKVLTIHSAKGLENKNVIVVGARTYNEEERKIAYVGATRAENRLYWCPAVSRRVRGRRKDSTTTGHIKTDMIEF